MDNCQRRSQPSYQGTYKRRPPMPVECVPAKPEHVSELGRICYEAFKDLKDQHGVPSFPSVAAARRLLGMLVQSETLYSVVAVLDGQPVGSNFLSLLDEVPGVGPLSVEVPHRKRGIGSALMQNVIEYA